MEHVTELHRIPRRDDTCMVPRPLGNGLFQVDATWGHVQPIELAPGVRTVGELEVIEHLERGLPVIDTRLEEFYRDATIPRAVWISHEDVLDRRDELDPGQPSVLFCNGPQCRATPDAIGRLLDSGYPPEALLYYRGGIHDWVTLGYPTVAGASG